MEFMIDTDGCRRLKREPRFTFVTYLPGVINQAKRALYNGTTMPVTTPGGLQFRAHIVQVDVHTPGPSATILALPTGAPLEPLTTDQRSCVLLSDSKDLLQALKDMKRSVQRLVAQACYDEAQTMLRPKKEKTPVKIKKFYVASKPTVENSDGRDWGKDTLAEAIAHATQLARERGEAQYVVRVIKVVAKRDEPVTVKDVK